MKTIIADAGENVKSAAERMMAEVAKGSTAFCSFNGISLTANKDSTADSILSDFHSKMEASAKAYRESPEGIAAAKERANKIIQLQEKSDALMSNLPDIDWPDKTAILGWLCAMEEPRDHIGVTFNFGQMVNEFTIHGYTLNMNTKDAFNKNNKDNFAGWIIGQALQNPYPPLVRHFTEQWKERFERG